MTDAPKAGTKYVILRNAGNAPNASPGQIGWQVVGQITAATSEGAIREAVGLDDKTNGGSFVAVPERSWKPVRVKVETKKTVTLGGV